MYIINSIMINLKILAIHTGMIPSAEIALEYPFNELKKIYKFQYDSHYIGDIITNRCKINLNNYNLIIFLRSTTEGSVTILRQIKELHKKIIYITDDDFENIDPTLIEGHECLKFNPKKHIDIFGRHVDQIWVYNSLLKDKFSLLNKNVKLMPSYLTIEEINKIEIIPKDKKGLLYIGYASGIHNRKNLSVAIPGLKRILIDFKDKIYFETFFGTNKYNIEKIGALSGINQFPNVISQDPIIGIKNFHNHLYQKQWDIGIAPLQNDLFNNAKTNNKYREYGMLKIPSIYSNVEAYTSCVTHNINGVLVDNTEEAWYTAIKDLILNSEKREYIKTNAYNDVYKKYNKEIVLNSYITAIKELMEEH